MALQDSLVPKNTTEPIYQNAFVDERGYLQDWARNWFEAKGRQIGEVISGVNRNAENIVQLETDYQAADGAISTAYIAADAVVASDAASARATLSTTLTAAYEADDAVLQANIDAEASTRASADTANATSIQTVEARLSYRMPTDFESLAEDYSQSLSGTPSAVSDNTLYSSSDGIATVTLSGAIKGLYPKAVLRNIEDGVYKLIVKWRVTGTTEPSGTNAMLIAFQALNSSYSSVSARGFIIDTYDGTSNIRTSEISWTANGSDVWLRPRIEFRGDMVDGTGEILDINVIGPDNDTALTSVLQEAFIDTDGTAKAQIVLTAATGGDPARISLTDGAGGSSIALDADEVFFGSDTVFEDTNDTFYTEAGGERYRYGGPFGASTDLLQWFGPDSVSLNSESKTNGNFAFATDGNVYIGSNNASALTGAKVDGYPSYVGSADPSVTNSVTASAIGGDGTYTYAWTMLPGSDAAISIDSASAASTTFRTTGGTGAEGIARCTITETSSGDIAYVDVPIFIVYIAPP